MSVSNARAFKYHTGLLKEITCNLSGSPCRMNLGVIIFNGRTVGGFKSVAMIFSYPYYSKSEYVL